MLSTLTGWDVNNLNKTRCMKSISNCWIEISPGINKINIRMLPPNERYASIEEQIIATCDSVEIFFNPSSQDRVIICYNKEGACIFMTNIKTYEYLKN